MLKECAHLDYYFRDDFGHFVEQVCSECEEILAVIEDRP